MPLGHSLPSSRTRANHTVARLPLSRYGAGTHPLRHAAPVTSRYTRYVAKHPLRSDAPDQKGCNAYGSGAPPPTTSTTADNSSPQTPTVHLGHCDTASTCSPGSAREPLHRLHQLGSVTPAPSWCNTPPSGATPLNNKKTRGHTDPSPSGRPSTAHYHYTRTLSDDSRVDSRPRKTHPPQRHSQQRTQAGEK